MASTSTQLFSAALTRSWKPSDALLDKFASVSQLPPQPNNWLLSPGWTRYAPNSPPQHVDYPLEDTLAYDIEKLYKISDSATLATAVSDKAWYGWCSKYITGSDNPRDMIPMNPKNEKKVVIGFNVGYDRMSVDDEYNYGLTSQTTWIDVLAWYVSGCGFYEQEKNVGKVKFDSFHDEFFVQGSAFPGIDPPVVPLVPGLRTLAAVYGRLVGGELMKDTRKLFGSMNRNVVINDFQRSMRYCASDVTATFKIFKKMHKSMTKKIHPVHLAAMSQILGSKLFINKGKWSSFLLKTDLALIKTQKDVQSPISDTKSLKINYKNNPVVSCPTTQELVALLPSGQYGQIPNNGSPLYSRYTLLNPECDSLWHKGLLTPQDPHTAQVVSSTINSRLWERTKIVLQEQTYVPVTDTIDCAVPMVRPCYDESWRPYHPFFLNPLPESVLGSQFEHTIEMPPGCKRVMTPLELGWAKEAIKSQEKASLVSPYLLRNAFDRYKVLYVSHMVVGAQELFEMNSVKGYALLSTMHKDISFLVPDKDAGRAHLLLNWLKCALDEVLKEQMGVAVSGEDQENLLELEEGAVLMGLKVPGLSLSNAFSGFTKVYELHTFRTTNRQLFSRYNQ